MNRLKHFDVEDYVNLVLVGKHLHDTWNDNTTTTNTTTNNNNRKA